jgi:ABC-2 type transport system ATP-binding protein
MSRESRDSRALHRCAAVLPSPYIWKCLHGAAKEGVAVLVSSHNTEQIVYNCDRFYMFNNHNFKQFTHGDKYIDYLGAENLDDAFIRASGNF